MRDLTALARQSAPHAIPSPLLTEHCQIERGQPLRIGDGVNDHDPAVLDQDRALLERLADPTSGAAKAASRDLGPLLARGALASTTVSATMRAAYAAGIRIFATGGIGAVHRGAAHTFDVSSDIDELATTPVAVVSSGAKSILDLPATLELLETRRVPVVG